MAGGLDVDAERECECFQQMTNSFRLRRTSDEELASFLADNVDESKWCQTVGMQCPPHKKCELCAMEWLQSPCENPDARHEN
jgi:hypothetical protein